MTGPRAAIGLDVGGTKVAGGIVTDTGEVLHRITAGSVVDGRRDPGLRVARGVADALVAHASVLGIAPQGIGIGLPEYVRADGTVASRLVMEWDVQPLQQFDDMGNVVVDSDVRCGARAEATLGAGAGIDTVLYVSVGTGISCATTVRGVPWMGRRGEAIALGELPVAREVDAGCTLTLEEYASGAAIARRFADVTGAPTDGAQQVVEAAAAGGVEALLMVTASARAIAHAIGWAVGLIDPGVVVLGGGLGTSAGVWADALRSEYHAVTSARPDPPELRVAALGTDAGLVGAALASMEAPAGN